MRIRCKHTEPPTYCTLWMLRQYRRTCVGVVVGDSGGQGWASHMGQSYCAWSRHKQLLCFTTTVVKERPAGHT